MYQRYVKRLLDLVLSLIGLIVISPVLAILAIWIRLDSPGPVLFTQRRVGKGKTYFNIYKFRTMRIDAPHDVPTHLLGSPDAFITRSGRFLRRTSLNELPQIFNILKGEMSIVGPRPALWNQEDLIAERDKYGANDIVPGLTGWAQVNGRDELEIEEKAMRDGEYARHVTIKMDMTCFLMTIGNVLRHKGVVEGGTGRLAPHVEARQQEIDEEKEKAQGA